MTVFNVGDSVKINAEPLDGNIGTIEVFNEDKEKYLVRVNDLAQHYFAATDLEPFNR